MMKQINFPSLIVACLMMITLTSCSIVSDIFKAGAWTGIIAVVLVVGLVIWLIARMFK